MIAIHRVRYQLLLTISIQIAKGDVVRVPGACAVQDVFLPRIVEAGAKLVPAKSPCSVEVLAHNDFFVPIAVDIFKSQTDIEAPRPRYLSRK